MPKPSAKPSQAQAVTRRGRPNEFTQEVADELCERIAKGESLRSICADRESGWLPHESTVYRWLAEDPVFREQYMCARERQADFYVEQIVEIADAANVSVGPDGEPVLRDPQRDRLRVDARKWVAAKLAPKRYGDRQQHDVELNVTERRTVDARNLPEDQREQLRAILTSALQQVEQDVGQVIEGEFSVPDQGE